MDTAFGKLSKRGKEEQEVKKGEVPQGNTPKEKIAIKVVLVGETFTGAKTSFTHRYVNNEFSEMPSPTVGASFCTKTVICGGREVIVQIWDTAGQDLYATLSLMYLRGADGIVAGYDITDKKSYTVIRQRYVGIMGNYPNAIVMLIGNKADLDERREVTVREGEELARELGTPLFFETSAKTGFNVNESMDALINAILEAKGY